MFSPAISSVLDHFFAPESDVDWFLQMTSCPITDLECKHQSLLIRVGAIPPFPPIKFKGLRTEEVVVLYNNEIYLPTLNPSSFPYTRVVGSANHWLTIER